MIGSIYVNDEPMPVVVGTQLQCVYPPGNYLYGIVCVKPSGETQAAFYLCVE